MSTKSNKNRKRKLNSRKLVALATATALTLSLPTGAFAASNEAVAVSATADSAQSTTASSSAEGLPTTEANVQLDAAITKTKAIALAQQYVSIPETYKLQSASLSSSFRSSGQYSVWSLSYTYQVKERTLGNINVTIDAGNGELIGYNSYTDDTNVKPVYPAKVDRDQATEVAQSFIAKVAAAYKDQVELDAYVGVGDKPPLTGKVVHSIRFNRIVNGIPFVENYIDLQIDGEGHVLSYNRYWDNSITFDKAAAAVTSDEAVAKLQAAASPTLAYIIPYQMKPRKPLLVYGMAPVAISAITGEVVGGESTTAKETQISAKPLGTKPSSDAALTKEQAAAKVDAAFGLPKDAKLTSSEYGEYADDATGKNRSYWQLSYSVESADKNNGGTSIYAQVDAQTGEVRSYSAYNSANTGTGATYAAARTKAIEVLGKQLGWLADQYYLMEYDTSVYENKRPEQIGNYYFNAVRKVNGVSVDSESVQVSISAYDGSVESYWSNTSGFEFPAIAPKVIGDDKAADAWMDYYRVQLTYQSEYNYYWDGQPIPVEKYKLMVAAGEIQPNEVKSQGEAKLVYQLVPRYNLDQNVTLDALTGQWINADDGTVTTLERQTATDIEGHWAQRELELMVTYKALDLQDGKVNPNAVITRGEMIKMLVLAMNQGTPIYYASDAKAEATASFNDVAADSGYFAYVETALQQQLIDVGDGTFNPEGKVDREEMAELIVRALGYNPLAEHDNLFNVTFSDADKVEQKGQAAIAVGLGIMTLQNGKFLPEREVTRAEAATAFFRFLQVKADLKEAPLRDK
ncbi:S-layer family protein [Paenibacillus cellulosilyticus]|uniref:S-layer family protein n=1 Tax=Paenibacillus cellulosilyticus TaxID=375489 RepID=A0A2V2YZK4_9BACL|nr:S-layer homology domain-containing protein [Paenibacillus cellulosilyticus]PWW08443.1 S-layer family protein [Paenibacillus cellulosilyticus]QKS48031.1 S-layer homology domain-containing protein [Paenibacillus cellulosilyticus]